MPGHGFDGVNVDYVDYAAYIHDMNYDEVNAKGATGLFKDWGTTQADIEIIKQWKDLS